MIIYRNTEKWKIDTCFSSEQYVFKVRASVIVDISMYKFILVKESKFYIHNSRQTFPHIKLS